MYIRLKQKNQIKKVFEFVSVESLFLIGALFFFVAVFELLPVVKEARRYVSAENLENFKLSCQAILFDRPWYGKVNVWFFAWIILTPALVFSIHPNAPAWLRGGRVIFATLACYGLINLAVHLQWNIRNGPFGWDSYTPKVYRMDCVNIADGFSLTFALIMAWIPACVYACLCASFWFLYHRFFSGRITAGYKSDIITRILSMCVAVYLALFAVSIVKPVGWIAYLTIRPLVIPFEIFWY